MGAPGSHRQLRPGAEEERPEAGGRSWVRLWVGPNLGQLCLKPLLSQGSRGHPAPSVSSALPGAPVPCREGAVRGPCRSPGLSLRKKGQRDHP